MSTKRAAYEVKILGKEILFKVFKPLKAAAAAAKNKNFMIVKKDLDARRKASKLKAQS